MVSNAFISQVNVVDTKDHKYIKEMHLFLKRKVDVVNTK